MPSLQRTRTVAAVVIAGLSAASCGGEEKLSKQDYIAQADKVCADIQAKIKTVPQPRTADALKGYVSKIKPLLTDAIDRFEALEPADEISGSADALIGSTRDASELADADEDDRPGEDPGAQPGGWREGAAR